MFVGHYAVGFALKRAEPRVPLGLLVLAAAWLDLLLAVLVLLNVEHMRIRPEVNGFLALDIYDMPISHSAAGALGWTLLAFVLYRFWPGRSGAGRTRPALVLAAAVLSHFVLDIITHGKDLPLTTNASAKIGLGLWRNVPVSIGLEMAVLVAGALLYAQATAVRSSLLFRGLGGLVLFQAAYLIGCFYGLMPGTAFAFGVRMTVEQIAFFGAVAWFDRSVARQTRS